jgi:hypothetical protein
VPLDESGTAQQLDIGFEFSPSGPGLGLVMAEEVSSVFATVDGYVPSLRAPDRREAVALIEFSGVLQVVYGYPNEEAFWKDPSALGHGIWEIHGSTWLGRLRDYNERTFGNRSVGGPKTRHLFIGSKDVSAQVLCSGFSLDSFPGARWMEVHAEGVRRLLS